MMRSILVGILAVMAVGIGFLTFQWYQQQNTPRSFGVPFALVDQNGQTITEAAFKGGPTAVFFGFTHCPEVCPTTLFELDGWLDQMGSEGEDIKAYFVSVDPERDTPEVMKAYLGNFSDRITGITGTPEQIAEMAKGFSIYARKVDLEGGDYTMDHTASIILLDSAGDFFGTIAYEENPDTALAKLKRLANET
ncbi:SCO family protein [Nitratireductor pacificus]|uniref:Electron transport protein SCO1/SenC n=1 Tax=Nitratireductor pacificus pht-3B TaxID=391937 RepID=K2MJD7_9HYPH|nr:SCO family protein [Nitratireductor pacificus]EKF20820.1 electron transport protein SCO1/SenC [Nitratireductor pacificus pht-3B]